MKKKINPDLLYSDIVYFAALIIALIAFLWR